MESSTGNRLRLNHFTAAQAGGADAHTLGGRAHASVYRTQIHIPASLGNVMRVADAVSRLRLLAADITLLCHDCCLILSELLTEALFYRIMAFPTIRSI